MLTITNIMGNLKKEPRLAQKYNEFAENKKLEKISIHRSESEKVRMRKVSDKGTDVGFILPSRTHLKDDDVVYLDEEKMIVIKQYPELVAIAHLKDDNIHVHNIFNMAVKIGHTIGNLHRPLKIENNNIIFPIQTQDEISLFLRLLPDLKNHIDIHSDTLVFEADKGFDIHEH